jgi:hypothetical protein
MTIRESEDIYTIVDEIFDEDHDLYTKYHYDSPTTHKQAVEHTLDYIFKSTPKQSLFYEIVHNQELIGFLCYEQGVIWDIGIKYKFRGDHIYLNKIWDAVFAFTGNATIRLYERNHRDINFLMRFMGAKPMSFDIVAKKLDYIELIPEGAVKGKEKHVFYIPLSQILLSYATRKKDQSST